MPMPRGHRVHPYDREQFGAELRSSRIRLGVSLNGLAIASGINKGSLHAAEIGRRSLPPTVRETIITMLEHLSATDGLAIDAGRLRELGDLAPATAMAGEAARILVPGQPAGVDPGWREWLTEGRRLTTVFAPEAAREAYLRAEQLANDPAARALAMSYRAHSFWKQDLFRSAMMLYQQGLVLLEIEHIPPESAPAIPVIEANLPGETALQAYAMLAQLCGFILHTQGAFDRAMLAYTTWERALRILGDSVRRADALRFLGKSVLELGTTVDLDDLTWRSPLDIDTIHRSIEYFRQARIIRPAHSGQRLADDWRQELRARTVLHTADADRSSRRALRHAETSAMAAVGPEPSAARMFLRMDRASMHLSEVHLRVAEELFTDGLDLATSVKSINSASSALSGLGHVYSMDHGLRQRALDHAIAALLLWTLPFETRDSRKTLDLFEHLGGTPQDVRQFVSASGKLQDQVIANLHPGDTLELRLATVLTRLAWHGGLPDPST